MLRVEELPGCLKMTVLFPLGASHWKTYRRWSYEAKAWGPALYAFRIGGQVVRLGKTESTLKGRMMETERLVSRALAGNFQLGGTNPWEAFEWRRRLHEHRSGELLARRGPTAEERTLIKRYDPPLCNDSPCARLRPPEARRVRDVATATAYWQQLNSSAV